MLAFICSPAAPVPDHRVKISAFAQPSWARAAREIHFWAVVLADLLLAEIGVLVDWTDAYTTRRRSLPAFLHPLPGALPQFPNACPGRAHLPGKAIKSTGRYRGCRSRRQLPCQNKI